jgi:ABC-type bacteriocin/lantibiotic exporter with double-glycine peptidase domain
MLSCLLAACCSASQTTAVSDTDSCCAANALYIAAKAHLEDLSVEQVQKSFRTYPASIRDICSVAHEAGLKTHALRLRPEEIAVLRGFFIVYRPGRFPENCTVRVREIAGYGSERVFS